MDPFIIALIVIVVVVLLSMSIKVVAEYERGVIFRLGRLVGAKGPGLFSSFHSSIAWSKSTSG